MVAGRWLEFPRNISPTGAVRAPAATREKWGLSGKGGGSVCPKRLAFSDVLPGAFPGVLRASDGQGSITSIGQCGRARGAAPRPTGSWQVIWVRSQCRCQPSIAGTYYRTTLKLPVGVRATELHLLVWARNAFGDPKLCLGSGGSIRKCGSIRKFLDVLRLHAKFAGKSKSRNVSKLSGVFGIY